MAKHHRYQLTVTSESSNLERVADFVSATAHKVGLDDQQSYNIQMAVDEAVTNVIEHAYRGHRDGLIVISCERSGDEFIVEIDDKGKPFNPSEVHPPRVNGPLSKRTIGGLGIFFMKKLMDRVEFSSNGVKGNRLRMTKRIE